MSALGVRRDKAALSSGCKSHPVTAPAGSNRSSHEVTNWLKPSECGSPIGDSASVQAATRVNAEFMSGQYGHVLSNALNLRCSAIAALVWSHAITLTSTGFRPLDESDLRVAASVDGLISVCRNGPTPNFCRAAMATAGDGVSQYGPYRVHGRKRTRAGWVRRFGVRDAGGVQGRRCQV